MYIPFTFRTISNYTFDGRIEYLIVGGGGAGIAGGGGAGGYITGSGILSGNTTYPVLVGAGGVGAGADGALSYGFNVSASGGGGGTRPGASGGGGFGGPGGVGIPGQGNNGGGGIILNNGSQAHGGGGGAGAVGGSAGGGLTFYFCGSGGIGKQWLDGTYYAGGGGGSSQGVRPGEGCAGGQGGGGRGGYTDNNIPFRTYNGVTGSVGTGGGGGGDAGFADPGNGGSGIVKLRYVGPPKATGGTITFDGTYTYHSFIGEGENYLTTFDYSVQEFPTPIEPNKVFYNVTKCNETSSFYIDTNTLWTPSTITYSTGSILYLNGSISGCFSVNSSIISSSLSGSTAGVSVQNLYGSCTTCLSRYPTFPISSSLVMWNALSGLTGSIWYDYSDNGNNGLVSGSTLILSGSVGSGSFGYSFNGTNNYVTYPTNLVGQPSSTYTLQYYGTIPSESLNRNFFVKEVFSNGWDTLYEPSTDRFIFRDVTASDKGATFTEVFASKQLYTITANANTNVMQLYINDTFITNFTGGEVNNFDEATVPFVFGFNGFPDATYWKGAVHDLLLFNTVLSSTEVSQSYAYLSSVPITPPVFPSASLVLWTDIDSLTGSVWYDTSGNGNNGLVSGSTLTLSGSLGYSFNGTNNYVTFPSTLVGQPSSSWTIQYFGTMFDDGISRDLWVKDDFNDGWDTIWEPSTDRFIFRDNNAGDIGLTYNYTPPNKVLVTLTLNDTTNKASLYINERLIVTGSGAINAFNVSTLPLKFGFNTNGDATYFKGAISDLLVYNKELNATEVYQSYDYLISR